MTHMSTRSCPVEAAAHDQDGRTNLGVDIGGGQALQKGCAGGGLAVHKGGEGREGRVRVL